jgi:hypothetical protein
MAMAMRRRFALQLSQAHHHARTIISQRSLHTEPAAIAERLFQTAGIHGGSFSSSPLCDRGFELDVTQHGVCVRISFVTSLMTILYNAIETIAIDGCDCVVFGRRKSCSVEKMCTQGFMELDPCGYRVQSAHVVELWRFVFQIL